MTEGLHENFHNGRINFLTLFLPVFRERLCGFLGGDGELQLDERLLALLDHAVYRVVLVGVAEVVGKGRRLVAHLIGMQNQIVGNLPADLRRDFILEIFQGLFSLIGHTVVGCVVGGLDLEKTGMDHLRQHLLEMKIRGVFAAQDQIGDLGIGERKGDLSEHEQNDKLI